MLTEQLHVRLNYLTQECLKKGFYHRKRFLMNPSRTLSPSPTPNPTPSMANGASFHRFSGNLTNNCRNSSFTENLFTRKLGEKECIVHRMT